MTTELSTMLALIAVVAIAVAGGGIWWVNRPPSIRRDASEGLPLFTGLGPSIPTGSAAPPLAAPPPARPPGRPISPPVATPAAPAVAQVVAVRPTIREFTTTSAPPVAPRVAAPPARVVDAPVVSAAGVPGTMVEGSEVRFSVPAEGTLQFLPGRLEIGSGFDAGREIRFVRVPGPDGTSVTFGRTEGALYRHVQLRDKTVSRQHAEMHWRDGLWYLRNLSQTNPVARNGVLLDAVDEVCLRDGDRIDMGEVIFTFRSR